MDAPRWHFRFENFATALALLAEAVDRPDTLSTLEREGALQRFEYTWELAWKSLRDYLRDHGIEFGTPIPANVIRAGFRLGLIADGDLWMKAKEARNTVAHEYSRPLIDGIFVDIQLRYFAMFVALHERLAAERNAGN